MRIHTNLHYQSSFEVCPADGSLRAWKTLVKTVRAWMRERSGLGPELGHSWFYSYGTCPHPTIRHQFVETNREIGNGTLDEPEFWAARMQIQDGTIPDRIWRTDIGLISRAANHFTVGITVTNYLRPGYIGPEPPTPSLSAPRIVNQLLADYWMPHSGDLPLANGPMPFGINDVPHVIEMLSSQKRRCPIVWVTREKTYLEPLVAPEGLSSKIAGAAVILISTDGEAETALIEALPYKFRALNGMIRIYQPGVKLNDDNNARLHRYYTKHQIDEFGPSQVAVEIIRALTRRIDLSQRDTVFTIEDVKDRHRRNRLQLLRERHAPENDAELIDLLESDNNRLEETIEELRNENTQLGIDLIDALECEQLQRDRADEATRARIEMEKSIGNIEKSLSAIYLFKKLPDTIHECAVLISHLFPQRIFFTSKALASAKDASFNDVRSDIGNVWRLLWVMANDLHDFIFQHSFERRELERLFKEKCGFDLSFTESETTRRNPKFMSLRKFTYDGRNLSMEPHAKIDRKDRNRFLRVHFAVDDQSGLIIVNHCGNHLDNAATRKRN